MKPRFAKIAGAWGMVEVFIRAILVNRKAVEALDQLSELIDGLAKDQPWNSEIQEAARLLQIIERGIKTVAEPDTLHEANP